MKRRAMKHSKGALDIWVLALVATLLMGVQAMAKNPAKKVRSTSSTAVAESMSLENFLGQVRSQNDGVKSAKLASEGAGQRSGESALMFTPQLFLEASHLHDGRPTNTPAFQGNLTTGNRVSLGVQKLFDFGLQAKLYQAFSSVSIRGAGATFLPRPNWVDSAPTLELSQSLWKNGFGRETRAQSEQQEASALAASYSQAYGAKLSLASAESAYWGLALARETLLIQEDSLGRAQKIHEWASSRAKLDLADKADLLQANASVKLQELQLKSAQDGLREAQRSFNLARGIDSDEVGEKLVLLTDQSASQLSVPARAELRDDVKAAQQQQRIAAAASEIGKSKNAPTFDVFANLSLNGRDASFGNSFNQSYGSQYPYALIGVKFAAPLDFDQVSENRAGYIKESQAAELGYVRKRQEQDSDWKNLTQKFEESRQRLSLVREIEEAQRVKAEYERERLKRARTTVFQVIQFEEQYAASRLTRLQLEAQLLGLVAQLKTFGGSDESR